MDDNAKYQIEEQLASSPTFLLYKAIQEETHERVILKMLNPPYPSEYALHRIESEFSILQTCAFDYIFAGLNCTT